MKLIIIEGTDNTGKDTLISKILEKYPTATVIHCGKPITKKFLKRYNQQQTQFPFISVRTNSKKQRRKTK